jgi:hypothetical protein
MHTEDLILYQSGYWKIVEDLSKGLPQSQTIGFFALIIKTVYPVNRSALVVSP